MKRQVLAAAAMLTLTHAAVAQLPRIKIPGTNKRIDMRRDSSGTPTVTGVTGTCKNGDTRDIVIKVSNVDPQLLNNMKVETHPPFEVVSSGVENGDIHLKVKSAVQKTGAEQYGIADRGADRCDFNVKFYKNKGDQYPQSELAASTKADPSDAWVAAMEKQKKDAQESQQRQAEAMASAERAQKQAQPAMQSHQKASVGEKWTVHWASGKTETWNFANMDNTTNMAVFKTPSGEAKIMFAGMFYTIAQGQCSMMAQPEGEGKVSGKTMGGNCANSGEFTASVE